MNMNWGLLIIGSALVMISFIALGVIAKKSKSTISGDFGLFILLGMVGTVFFIIGFDNTPTTPTAIDVYNNKTELRITYTVQGCDTLQRDSVVVWNDDYDKRRSK